MLSEDEARALTADLLRRSRAEEAMVSVSAGRTSNLRFARNSPTTSGEREALSITVTSGFGTRRGSATVNQRDAASLEAVVRRSEDIARLAPEDPEHMPALPPQTYPAIPGAWDADTAERAAELLGAGVATCLRDARERGVTAAGFAEAGAEISVIASSTGLFGYHRATSATLTETARTEDASGSGWASSVATGAGRLAFGAVSATATGKALASARPRALPPGSYVTILEPSCTLDLAALFANGLDARRADEGRSYLSLPAGKTRLGERMFGPEIELVSDPADPRLPGAPWSGEWLPRARTTWVGGGALKALSYDRYWAQKQGVAALPGAGSVLMSGGRGGVDELIAGTKRGVLVTSFWYIRWLDPRSMLLTGLTRDGVFWIEDGKIAYPVNNFRWNESPVAVLKKVEAMSEPVTVLSRNGGSGVAPAIRVSGFDFASVSDAV